MRLLIAVGIGKTVEAALIARELLERGEIKRLAVLCPPQLAVIAKKRTYCCSNGEPVEIAWRGCYERVSRVFVPLARRDGENARTRVERP